MPVPDPHALRGLMTIPVVQAPMAGGASGPALAAAVSGAGGLGFLAAGYKTAAALSAEIAQTRELTGAPFGVNLFVPSGAHVDTAAVEAYAVRLRSEADRLGVPLGDPVGGDDDWGSKLEVLLADPVPAVSFAFGLPDPEVAMALRSRGSLVIITVTSPEEAAAAAEAADALCVQGAEAGGHRGSFADTGAPATALGPLIAAVRQVTGLPLIAAGGLMTGSDLAGILSAGAAATQLGTAFLRTDESGASLHHKAALADPHLAGTAMTRAFSGRTARGLVNRFLTEHSAHAPAAYPQVHHLTAPLRRAAARLGDTGTMALWAGTGHRHASTGPAAAVLDRLAWELGRASG